MNPNTPKARAHALSMEWIDCGGRACLRPMHFGDDGVREVRMFPSETEFEDRETALARLEAAERATAQG